MSAVALEPRFGRTNLTCSGSGADPVQKPVLVPTIAAKASECTAGDAAHAVRWSCPAERCEHPLVRPRRPYWRAAPASTFKELRPGV